MRSIRLIRSAVIASMFVAPLSNGNALRAAQPTPADARAAAKAVERMPLVNAARGQCTLVLPENATKQNRAAAELLRDNLARSTGARLPIEAESKSNPAKPRVHVGLTDFAKRKCGNLSDLDDDGFVLFPVDEKNLILAGPTDWGTEFAVCDFLERFVGVRWLLPGPQGTYVPKQTDVSGTAEKIQQEPACFSRLFSGLRGDAQGVWARRNRMHGRVSFHHNLLRLFPPSKYGKTHPEFFPIHDGKRYIPARDDIHGWQPCFSAPGIVDEAVRNIKAYFKAHPETTSYSLGVTDSAGHCQCDACQAQDPGTNNAIGIRDVSDRYFAWCNKVVNAVLKEYPDKWFGCLAYRQVFEPPGKIKVHPRIIPYLTYDRMKWADPEQREAGHRLTERWQRVCPTLGWYEYLYGTPYLLPRVYFHQMAENYRYASRHGVRAHYAEAYPNWGEGPKLYLSLKLQWDPDQDVDALLRDWYVACVGEDAADDLAAYYRLWEGFWTGPALKSDWFTPRGEYLRFSSPEYLQAVTPKMIQQSGNRLRAALAKTKTDDQRARATLLLHAFEYYQVSALAYLGGRKINVEDILTEKDALTVLADAPRTIQMADRRLELVNSFADDPVLVHPLPPTRYPLLAGLSRWSIAAMWGLQPWAERSEAVRHRLDELARSDMPAVAREAKTLLQFTAGHYQLVSKNPSFEAGKNKTADDWSFWVKSSGTLQRTNEVRHDGNWSVVAEGFARGGPYQVLPVTPGRYIGVCQVYVPSGQESRGTVELAITMRDATGKNLEEAKTRITPAPGNWISVAAVLDVTAASRGKDVTHVLFCPIVNGFRGDQRVYLDDCRLVRLTE